jgi:hypothetical protein
MHAAPAILHEIRITPTTHAGRDGFSVGPGINGTSVFVHSARRARTVRQVLRDEASGELTADQRWDVIVALVRDDEFDALKVTR